MTQAALGTKRKCLGCGAAFFDLRRNPIVCPRCNVELSLPPPAPLPYKRKIPTFENPMPAAPEVEEEADPEVEGDDEDSETAIDAERD